MWMSVFMVLVVLIALPAWSFSEKDLAKFKAVNSCEKCDLSKADLERANLSGAHLSFANLERADLEGANLTEANLSV